MLSVISGDKDFWLIKLFFLIKRSLRWQIIRFNSEKSGFRLVRIVVDDGEILRKEKKKFSNHQIQNAYLIIRINIIIRRRRRRRSSRSSFRSWVAARLERGVIRSDRRRVISTVNFSGNFSVNFHQFSEVFREFLIFKIFENFSDNFQQFFWIRIKSMHFLLKKTFSRKKFLEKFFFWISAITSWIPSIPGNYSPQDFQIFFFIKVTYLKLFRFFYLLSVVHLPSTQRWRIRQNRTWAIEQMQLKIAKFIVYGKFLSGREMEIRLKSLKNFGFFLKDDFHEFP